MKLKDILNEFELDYVQAPSRISNYDFDKLRNNKILVIGESDDFTYSVAYSFLNLNDDKQLNIKVNLMILHQNQEELYKNKFIEREDLNDANLNDDIEYDYIICTALCNKKISSNVHEVINNICSYDEIFKSISRLSFNKLIFMSDYRVNGNLKSKFVASEYELSSNKEDSYEQMVLKSLESLCVCYAKQYDFNYTILRTGVAYGASIEFSGSFIYDLIKEIKENKKINYTNDSYSFVYINDILTSIFFALNDYESDKVFNVDGLNSIASINDIITILKNTNLVDPDINYIFNNIKSNNYSINSCKLRHMGWTPKISLEDGLIMLVKSIYYKTKTFVFDDTYQGKLKVVHDILLAYLLEIDRICKKHDIKYFLAGGTLLGAIRHKGFIPWDDDADVMMLREDYDKFLSVVKYELPSNLFLQTSNTEEENHQVFAKIRINNTLFATKFTSGFLNMHNGIFVDILSHDRTSNTKLGQRLHMYSTMIARSMVFNKWGKTEIKTGGRFPILCKLLNIVKDILPMRILERLQNMMITLYKHYSKSQYLYDGMGRNLKRGSFPRHWLQETIYVDFEGYKLPVPKYYDEYLTYLYGDYMQMIPVSERKLSHDIVLMDLGEYMNFKVSKNKSKSKRESISDA